MLKESVLKTSIICFNQKVDIYFPQFGNVAISIGFVEVMNRQSATDVISMADDALYYAKYNGRNQTVFI
jgi:PleD family two-component response regulator